MPTAGASPEVLRRQLGRKPVLWVGAGVSCQADPPLPTLWRLATGLGGHFAWDPLPKLDDPYELFDRGLEDGVFRAGELHDYIEEMVRPGGRDPKPGPLHVHLAELAADGAFPFIIDTNYDLLLRRAMQDIRAPHTHSVLQQNLARPVGGCWYLSIHGDMNDWSRIILTKQSYREFDHRYRFLRSQLDLVFIKHPISFVGCSMTDPQLLDWLADQDATTRDQLKSYARVAFEGSLESQGLLLAVQAGPIYAATLASLGYGDEAQRVAELVLGLLQRLPEHHPVRDAVEREIGLRQ